MKNAPTYVRGGRVNRFDFSKEKSFKQSYEINAR